ncbi:MAG TPA: hypothetical protein VJL89_00535 [Thermodesulfovibrionia bacterium]|nr:hypothetical protein [Thermodesulfovibrionia bacterium]
MFQVNKLVAKVEPMTEGFAALILISLLLFALHRQITIPVLLTFAFMLYRLQPQFQRFNNTRAELLGLSGSVQNVMGLLEQTEKFIINSGTIPSRATSKSNLTIVGESIEGTILFC